MLDERKGVIWLYMETRKKTKILIVGYEVYNLYAPCFSEALKTIDNLDVLFYAIDLKSKKNAISSFCVRFENHYMFGKFTRDTNHNLFDMVQQCRPDVVFLYTARNIYSKTVKKIKELGCIVITYNNDNPFSEYYPKYFWRHYIGSLRYSDMAYTFRHCNIEQCLEKGAKKADVLRAYYRDNVNFYIPNPSPSEYVPSVVFLGHYEADNRTEYINYIADCGIEIGVSVHAYPHYDIRNKNIYCQEKSGTEYNIELNATKIALVFLSKINKDTYTNRCFEIPATKTMMLSEYTDDLATMYEEDKEIVFFRSKEELVEKIKYYLSHDEEREKIAVAGYERLIKAGHEVKDRAKQVMKCCEELKGNSQLL